MFCYESLLKNLNEGWGVILEVVIWIGSSCHLKGSRDIVKILERLISMPVSYTHLDCCSTMCAGSEGFDFSFFQ